MSGGGGGPIVNSSDILIVIDTGYKITEPTALAEEMAGVDAENYGFDIIIECSGFPPALEQALSWTKRGATAMVFGCAPPGKYIKLCPEDVFRKVRINVIILGVSVTCSGTDYCRQFDQPLHLRPGGGACRKPWDPLPGLRQTRSRGL